MYDNEWQRQRQEADQRRRLRRTWPALIFTAAFVAGLTVSVGFGIMVLVSSWIEPGSALAWFPWGPAAAVALAIGCLGWIALHLFLRSRGSPPHGLRNFVVLGAAASLGAVGLVGAQASGFVVDYAHRVPAREQARAMDEQYQRDVEAATARWEQTFAETIGEDGLMNGHLHGRGSIPDVRRRLNIARGALVQHENDIAAARAAVYLRIDEAPLNPIERAQLRAGFESGFAWSDSYRHETYHLNRRILDGLDAQLDILDASPGRWEISGDRILFDDLQTLAAYNRSQSELLYSVAELNAHERRIAEANSELGSPTITGP